MALTLATVAANASANAIASLLDGGSVRIYDGTRPATANTAVTTQILLAEPTFASPAFATAVAGVATAHAITDEDDCPASGTAAWFRAVTSGGAAVFDGTVGTADTDCVLSNVAIVAHGTLSITSCTITAPLG